MVRWRSEESGYRLSSRPFSSTRRRVIPPGPLAGDALASSGMPDEFSLRVVPQTPQNLASGNAAAPHTEHAGPLGGARRVPHHGQNKSPWATGEWQLGQSVSAAGATPATPP